MSRGGKPVMRAGLAVGLALILGGALVAHGQELSRYEETVALAADGSAVVRVVLQVRRAGAVPALLPLRAVPAVLRAEGIDPGAARVVRKGSGPFIELDLARAASPARGVAIEYSLPGYFKAGGRPGPFGNRKLDYRFANISFAAIDRFVADVVLPAGHVFNAVSRFVPEPEKEGMVAPFAISRIGDRVVGRIDLAGVGLGGEVALSCTIRHGRRAPWLIFLLAALALAYLVFFRDVLRANGGRAAGKRQ